MELVLAGVIAGLVLAIALFKVLWVVVSPAVENLYRWAIYSFGNEDAVRRQRESEGSSKNESSQ